MVPLLDPMSAAKRALRRALVAWSQGGGPAPQLLLTCDACGEERWRPLDRRHGQIQLDAHLPHGRRADLTLSDGGGRLRFVVQLEGGSRLPSRAEAVAGVPVVVLDAAEVVTEPLRWRPVRGSALPRWRCRCALAKPLPVDDAFSLRVLSCPINSRRESPAQAGGTSASVIHDCARCSFFVGIGYADAQRRRVSLYCAFGASTRPRIGPVPAPRFPSLAVVAGNPTQA
jgi:hypothetical protein